MVYAGPKLKQDLFSVLTLFRYQRTALVCDISEMYLQIELTPEDRQFHRFLWRVLERNQNPAVYNFNRVVFGVSSSPFLAHIVAQENARRSQWKIVPNTWTCGLHRCLLSKGLALCGKQVMTRSLSTSTWRQLKTKWLRNDFSFVAFASVFDPLGFVSPFVVQTKNLVQEILVSGSDWDDPLPLSLTKKHKIGSCTSRILRASKSHAVCEVDHDRSR